MRRPGPDETGRLGQRSALIRETIRRQGEETARDMDGWLGFQFVRQGRLPQLRLLASPDGSAQAVLRRYRDGTLSLRDHTGQSHDHMMDIPRDQLAALRLAVRQETMRRTMRQPGIQAAVTDVAASENHSGAVYASLDGAARQAVSRILRNAAGVTGPRKIPMNHDPHKARKRIIRSHIADPRVLELANRAAGREYHDRISVYNLTVLNRELFGKMQEREAPVLQVFLAGSAREQPAGRGRKLTAQQVRLEAGRYMGTSPEETHCLELIGNMFSEYHLANRLQAVAETCRTVAMARMGPERAREFAEKLHHVNTAVTQAGGTALEHWRQAAGRYSHDPDMDAGTMIELGRALASGRTPDGQQDAGTMSPRELRDWARATAGGAA